MVHKSTVHTKCVAIGHCWPVVVVVVVTKLATTIIAITIDRGKRGKDSLVVVMMVVMVMNKMRDTTATATYNSAQLRAEFCCP